MVVTLSAEYERSVFINCPFDADYTPLFEAIVFAVSDAGFRPKCARGRLDSSEVRLQKIIELIQDCRYSIHDLSRTALDETTSLPRFNMPLELGIDQVAAHLRLRAVPLSEVRIRSGWPGYPSARQQPEDRGQPRA